MKSRHNILLVIVIILNVFNFDQVVLSRYCGDDYLQPINGVMGDQSCGFNSDMYLAVLSLVLIGIWLVISLNKRHKRKK